MSKEEFLKLLENAKEDEYGNLYVEQKEFDDGIIFKELGNKKWYFSLSNTLCDDLIEQFCSQDSKNNFELYDRHFWNDDTLEIKIINNGKPKEREN